MLKNHGLKYLYLGRKQSQVNGKLRKKYYDTRLQFLGKKHGLELSLKNVGDGLLLAHPYGITVNGRAFLGKNVTIFKGATIGSVRSGKREGVPVIGDRVTVCTNAFVCGNIKIGNDVLIAANSFVNFDVPDNSLVIGNPAVIKYKENASADYLTYVLS